MDSAPGNEAALIIKKNIRVAACVPLKIVAICVVVLLAVSKSSVPGPIVLAASWLAKIAIQLATCRANFTTTNNAHP